MSDLKEYQNKDVLAAHYSNGLTAKQIANLYNVSYKLINVWAIKFGLISRTPDVRTP